MAHLLKQTVRSVARRARRLALVYALAWVVVVVVGSVCITGLLDSVLRLEYPPLRILASLGVVAAIVWAVLQFFVPFLRRRLSDVAVAQRVQERFPELKDRFASAVEFLDQSEETPQAGSTGLRRAVIIGAVADVERLNVGEVFDRRPAFHAALAALAACGVAVLLAAANPAAARIAATRLINPWGGPKWPRLHELTFQKPHESLSRIASGDTFEGEVVDQNGRLPREVFLQYRFEDDPDHIFNEPMHFVDDLMIVHRENVRRPFEYRAVGGDHQTMPWRKLEVLEPPHVASMKVKLTPPKYTGWPPYETSGRIVALVGTKMEIEATATKPLESARVEFEGGATLPAAVSESRLALEVPRRGGESFVIRESETFRFELFDTDQIEGGADDKWQIRAVPDEPPSVAIEKPASEIYVTSQAVVPVRVIAKDHLQIRDMALAYLRGDDSEGGVTLIPLYQGPPEVPPSENPVVDVHASEGDRRVVLHQWDLSKLAFEPGTLITFHARATDYQPKLGQSPALRIHVITPKEFENRLARRQALILGELARILKQQEAARARTKNLEIQMDEVGWLSRGDLDQLQGVELQQRDIRRSLAGDTEGVQQQIKSLLSELENNKIRSPDIQRKMTQLSELIRELNRTALAEIERDLTAALKNSQAESRGNDAAPAGDVPKNDGAKPDAGERPSKKADPSKKKEVGKQATGNKATEDKETDKQSGGKSKDTESQSPAGQALARAGKQQEQVISALESALGELKRWDNFRQFAHDLDTLAHEQDETQKKTEQMRPQTLGRDVKDLKPQETADLKKLAQKQLELARRFEKIADRMKQSAENLKEKDPLSADSIEDALDHAREKSIQGQMRSAGKSVSQNQVSAASRQQKAAAKAIQEMLDRLSDTPERELSRLVKKLREAEKELRQMREEQASLRKKLKKAAKIADEEKRKRELKRLAREQRDLQNRMDRLARRLRRLWAERASQKLVGASKSAGQSGQASESGDANQAAEKAEAAQQDLEDAQREVAKARKQAEQDLARELLVRLKDDLKALRDQQKNMLAETQRLEKLRLDQGRLTRGQRASVNDLGAQQKALERETLLAAKKLAAAETFSLALERAAREMGRAGDSLEQHHTGNDTQKAQQSAIARLDLVLDAFDIKMPKKPGKHGGGAGEGGENQGGQDAIHKLAEIKLLKLMQQEINAQTNELDEIVGREGEPDDAQVRELGQLAKDQGRLADLAFKLLKPEEDTPEDDPDALPGFDEDDLDGAGGDEPPPAGIPEKLQEETP